jgi:hypothetical protein
MGDALSIVGGAMLNAVAIYSFGDYMVGLVAVYLEKSEESCVVCNLLTCALQEFC